MDSSSTNRVDIAGTPTDADDSHLYGSTPDSSDRMSRMHPSSTNLSPTKAAIDFDRFYGDGSFLKLLQETLQKNASVLKQGVVKLALSPIAIAYLNDRLHATLCPKRATDNSGRVDGWTIRESAHTQSFLRVVSPRKRDIFNDDALVPVGHLDVLKLSTLLTETTCVKVTGTHEQPSLSMAVVYFNIFPSLKRIELNRLPVTALDQLACFVAQLEVLQLTECVMQSPLVVLRHSTAWTSLTNLKLVHCDLREWFPDEMRQVPVLEQLDCSHNRLSALHDLPAPSTLQLVTLSHNRLKCVTLSQSFSKLTWLKLDHNAFDTLQTLPWAYLPHLQHLDMSFNALDDLAEVSGLSQVRELQTLKLRGNPLAGFPDYRRQVLFYVGHAIELDDLPWTWTELDSMRFSRHNKRTADPLAYPRLPPKTNQLQARVVQILDPRPPYLPMIIRRTRTQSAAFSEASAASSVDRRSVASDSEGPMSPASSKVRAASYHVDEFLRDLAAEESPDTPHDDCLVPSDTFDHVMPPTTPGMVVTIFLSMEQADNLDLPLSRQGLTGLVHITPTKLMEYLPGGGVIQRHRAHLLCMAVLPPLHDASTTIQLGFRHRPTVAYKMADMATASTLARTLHDTLAEQHNVVALKCKACSALVVSKEKQAKLKPDQPMVLTIRQCWICKSANGREYSAENLPQCYKDLGLQIELPSTRPPQPPKPPSYNQNHQERGFYLDTSDDDDSGGGGDGLMERDEIIWVVTDTYMKQVRVTPAEMADGDEDQTLDKMVLYRRLCGI
ncbi:hypothetical protein H257_14512 [Aphanomyces astaci]|uniref:Uncharacterized protein n=1 Tax=Aphanomyces astaci TaxID=112090 RepID=W4FST4_APHAT|nr:hypothetical protein H257_14512 [Aphanomyces astaci]ETV69914.1 hypothetical protein H257_14512 [Aphanomyces astaci]|eukprot:XP_009840652.1 hypothetical protein H257_14512 [Aphanomyces astaci]